MAGSKADISAGQAYLRLFLKDDMTKALQKSLANVGSKLQSTGMAVAKIGAGVSAAGAAILTPIAVAVREFVSTGSALKDMSVRTGVSVEALSELGHAAGQTGATLSDVERGVKKMQQTVGKAGDVSKDFAKTLDLVGVSIDDLRGMNPEQQFDLLAKKIQAIEDPTQRAAAAMATFGKGGTKLLPMIAELDALRQEARDLGLVMSTEAAAKADELGDRLDNLWASVKGIGRAVAESLIDPLIKATKVIQPIITSVIKWVRENQRLVVAVAGVGVALLAAGSVITAIGGALIAAGFAASGLAAIIGVIGGVISAIASPIGIAIAAVVALGIAWVRFTASGQAALAAAREYFGGMLSLARDTIDGIVDALATGDLAAAGEIAFAGLHLVVLRSLDAIASIFGETIGAISSQILSGDFAGAWGTVTDSLTSMWLTFNEGVVSITTGMANAVVDAWEKVSTMIAQSILKLAGMPGFNELFKFASGIDLRGEIQRAISLGNVEGINDLNNAVNGKGSLVSSEANASRDLNNQALADARKAADDAKSKLLAGTGGEMSDLFFAALEAEGKLSRLTAAAKKKRESMSTSSATGAAAGEDETESTPGSSRKSLVTFSAAAAVASGYMGRSSESKMADDIKEMRELAREEKRIAAENLATDKAILESIQKVGGYMVYGA